MNYDEAVAGFFANQTAEGTVPEPTRSGSVARRLRDAIEPIAMHPVWSRRNNEALAAHGLDFFSGYAWGRAAALGEPAAAVVVSSFAVFEPGLIGGVYEAGREIGIDHDAGRQVLGGFRFQPGGGADAAYTMACVARAYWKDKGML